MLESTWIWTFLGVTVISLYFYFKHKYSYWTRLGVNGPPPVWGIGNLHQGINADVAKLENEFVQKYGNVFGTYFGTTPVITVADVNLVKQILIKDFQYFVNRLKIQAFHESWNKNLFSSSNEAWKRLRTITSPSFSSGKLRAMSSIMQKSVDKLDRHFEKLTQDFGSAVIETKATMSGFTIDVIAATAFATETSANDEGTNAFVINGRALFDINPLRGAATFLLPGWMLKLAGIETFFPPKAFNFFIDLAKHIVNKRKSSDQKQNDLVQLLMDASVDESELTNINYDKMTASDEQVKVEAMKEEKIPQVGSNLKQRKLTDSEIIANCIFFFIAGYETTGSTLSHCVFELAQNPDIQDRLSQELHQALDKFDSCDENISEEYFDTVMSEIPYLEAVIKETLRRYPPVSQMNRVCSKDGYMLGNIPLFKGEIVVIPTNAIHHNPEYYPEPKRFNPERFMPENKHLLVPYAYLPFSLGPRNCVAQRFAYQEIKLLLAKIVLKYRLDTTAETPIELTFKHGSDILMANPFPIQINKRLV